MACMGVGLRPGDVAVSHPAATHPAIASKIPSAFCLIRLADGAATRSNQFPHRALFRTGGRGGRGGWRAGRSARHNDARGRGGDGHGPDEV